MALKSVAPLKCLELAYVVVHLLDFSTPFRATQCPPRVDDFDLSGRAGPCRG